MGRVAFKLIGDPIPLFLPKKKPTDGSEVGGCGTAKDSGDRMGFARQEFKGLHPLYELCFDGRHEVDAFLRTNLSPHFDLRTDPVPAKKVLQFFVAPQLGIYTIAGCALGFAGLYLNHKILHSVIAPKVVMWLLVLWFFIVVGLLVVHLVILGREANKDNPWRHRQEGEESMIHELEESGRS